MEHYYFDTRPNITIAYQAEQQAYRFYAAADAAEAEGQWKFAEMFESYGDKAARKAAFHFGLHQQYGR